MLIDASSSGTAVVVTIANVYFSMNNFKGNTPMINNIFCGSMTSNLDTWIHIQKLKVTSRTCEVHESVFY